MWLRTMGGILLVAGTAIGAGMIGLPTVTALAGFQATTGCFLICWALMTLTAFWMLELCLRYPRETNLISLANRTLGPWGARIAWVVYLLFMYAIMTAYTTGGASLIHGFMGNAPYRVAVVLFVVLFGSIVTLGAHGVDQVNRVFMLILVAAYVALVASIAPHIEMPLLMAPGEPMHLLGALPLIVTAFGFQLLIPSLTSYMQYNVRALRHAIFWGSLSSLVIYLLWEAVILGTIPPLGPYGLEAVAASGDAVTGTASVLVQRFGVTYIPLLAKIFTFCALLTSYFGVGLGIFDFLADGLGMKKDALGRLRLALLTFGPPLAFSLGDPSGFIAALRYAGIFGAILLILFPAIMAWRERALFPRSTTYRVAAGGLAFSVAIACAVFVIVVQIVEYWPY